MKKEKELEKSTTDNVNEQEEPQVRWPDQRKTANRTVKDWKSWDLLTPPEYQSAIERIAKCKTDFEIVKVISEYRELVYSKEYDENNLPKEYYA